MIRHLISLTTLFRGVGKKIKIKYTNNYVIIHNYSNAFMKMK